MSFKNARAKLVEVLQRLILGRAARFLLPSLEACGLEDLRVSRAKERPLLTGRRCLTPFDEALCLRIQPQGIFGSLSVEISWLEDDDVFPARFVPDYCTSISVFHLKAQWARQLGLIMDQILIRVIQLAQVQVERAETISMPVVHKPTARRRSFIYEGDAISKLIAEFEAELPIEIDEYLAEFFEELSAQPR